MSKCQKCTKTAYPMESITFDKKVYHKSCFKCEICAVTISSTSNVCNMDGTVVCRSCFKKAFKERGKYSDVAKKIETTTGAPAVVEEKKPEPVVVEEKKPEPVIVAAPAVVAVVEEKKVEEPVVVAAPVVEEKKVEEPAVVVVEEEKKVEEPVVVVEEEKKVEEPVAAPAVVVEEEKKVEEPVAVVVAAPVEKVEEKKPEPVAPQQQDTTELVFEVAPEEDFFPAPKAIPTTTTPSFLAAEAAPAPRTRVGSVYGRTSVSVAGQSSKCPKCSKTAYPMESITFDGVTYHKTCFKCQECKRTIDSTKNVCNMDSNIFCKNCFTKTFKARGKYSDVAAKVQE